MASTHELATKLIGQNQKVQDDTAKLFRYLLQRVLPNSVVVSTAATSVATTTLTAVPALQVVNGVGFNGGQAVVGGRTYTFFANLYTTVDGTTAGIQVACNGGTATFTTFNAAGEASTTSTTTTVVTTAAATPVVTGVAATILIIIEGTFTAATSGSFGLSLAQNTAGGTAPILKVGSNLQLTELIQ